MERHGEIIDSFDGFGQRTYLAKAADGFAHIGEGSFDARLHRFCIERSAVKVPPIFDIIAREGGIPERDMFNTFNMGVGMCLTVAAEDVDLALDSLADAGEDGAYALGEIARGEGGIELC